MSIAIDLSLLPAPQVIEALDFESVLAALLADLILRDPSLANITESDPAHKLLEAFAYREILLRQRINAAARALMSAYATGVDLDHIAATYYNGAQRFTIRAADPLASPPVAEERETDSDFRRRLMLQPEGETVAGPVDSYISHTMDAHADVADASAYSPWPAGVVVTVLGRTNLNASDTALQAVAQALGASDILYSATTAIPAPTALPTLRLDTSGALRPVADRVIVRRANIKTYTIDADIVTPTGPDTSVIAATVRTNLTGYLSQPRRLGRDVARSAIYAALHVAGVDHVSLSQPSADIAVGIDTAADCTAAHIRINGQEITL